MSNSNRSTDLAGNTEDDELTLPRASMIKLIKHLVPSVRVTNEASEVVVNYCNEFINLLSSEVSKICNQLNTNTINAEHVLMALDNLGLKDCRAAVEAALKDSKTAVKDSKAVAAKRRRQGTQLENVGIPEKKLRRQQQESCVNAQQEQAYADQQQSEQLQAAAQQAQSVAMSSNSDDQDNNS